MELLNLQPLRKNKQSPSLPPSTLGEGGWPYPNPLRKDKKFLSLSLSPLWEKEGYRSPILKRMHRK